MIGKRMQLTLINEWENALQFRPALLKLRCELFFVFMVDGVRTRNEVSHCKPYEYKTSP